AGSRRIARARVLVSERRQLPLQRHEGIRRVLVDLLTSGPEGDSLRRGPFVEPNQRRVFARWEMGGLHEYGTGKVDDLCPALPSDRHQVSALRERIRRATPS